MQENAGSSTNRGIRKIGESAKSGNLHNRGICKIGESAKSGNLQNRGIGKIGESGSSKIGESLRSGNRRNIGGVLKIEAADKIGSRGKSASDRGSVVAALKIFYQIGSRSAKQKLLTEIAKLSPSHKQLPTLDSSEWQKASCLVSRARKS